jgi:hypothetical protein
MGAYTDRAAVLVLGSGTEISAWPGPVLVTNRGGWPLNAKSMLVADFYHFTFSR